MQDIRTIARLRNRTTSFTLDDAKLFEAVKKALDLVRDANFGDEFNVTKTAKGYDVAKRRGSRKFKSNIVVRMRKGAGAIDFIFPDDPAIKETIACMFSTLE